MMLHPVTYPNHGAVIELSLANEALGLVSSLDWQIEPGPNRHEDLLLNHHSKDISEDNASSHHHSETTSQSEEEEEM